MNRMLMLEEPSGAERIVELEKDNRRLRRLLDQRNAPAELRHRTRSTLSVLRAIISKSAKTDRDLEGYVAHLGDRVSALGRVQTAIDENGIVEMQKLVREELHMYEASERTTVEGPDVELPPKPGMLIALAVHELAVNSVEHGALGSDTGRVDISWTKSEEAENEALLFTWKERDVTAVDQPSSQGFGTEVLTRMLPYELKANVSLLFEREGVRCSIRLPLMDRLGQR